MAMQVNVDGVNLDNGSWRYIVGDVGDDISIDNTRMVVIDFVVQGSTVAETTTRWAQTRADFIKANPRVTVQLDDSISDLFADLSPNDGTHNSVKATVGVVGGKGQTAFSLYCRLYVEAGVVLFNVGGAAGSGPSMSTYTGLSGKISRVRTHTSGRIEARDLILTFAPTFDDDSGGAATIASVEDSGGKAVFVISQVPPAFTAGMRLKVTSSTIVNGAGYAGVHLITAINVATKKITTDTAFDGSETGSGAIGILTTGEDNYQAARASILTDLLGVENDGSRDSTTGLYLALEKGEHDDENEDMATYVLQSRYSETELTGLNDAQRDLVIRIEETEPGEWDSGGGERPVYLTVMGSIVCDKDELVSGSLVLHQVFRAQLVTQLKTRALSQSGYSSARLRDIKFASGLVDSRIAFQLVYQAKNINTLFYREEIVSHTEDDRVHWKAGPYDYDQRAEGLPPKTATKTVTYIGWAKKSLKVSPPAVDAGASWSEGPYKDGPEREFETPEGKLYSRTRTQVFYRRQYEGGAQGVKVV